MINMRLTPIAPVYLYSVGSATAHAGAVAPVMCHEVTDETPIYYDGHYPGGYIHVLRDGQEYECVAGAFKEVKE